MLLSSRNGQTLELECPKPRGRKRKLGPCDSTTAVISPVTPDLCNSNYVQYAGMSFWNPFPSNIFTINEGMANWCIVLPLTFEVYLNGHPLSPNPTFISNMGLSGYNTGPFSDPRTPFYGEYLIVVIATLPGG